MKKATKKLGVLCATMLCAATLVGGATALSATAAEASNVTTSWSNETHTSAYLDKLEISSFKQLTDFTDWFSLNYNSRNLTLTDYVSLTENGTVKISATQAVGFKLLPDSSTGYAQFGNFEVKMSLKNVAAANAYHTFFGSRIETDSNGYQYANMARVIISNGSDLTYWDGSSSATKVQGGANVSFSSSITVTMGFIDNGWYYYIGDRPNASLSNVSIYTRAYSANATSTRNGNQTFGFDMLTGANFELASFSYTRLSVEDYPYSAALNDQEASKTKIFARLNETRTGKHAVYKGGSTVEYLQSITIDEFDGLYDFTDYFSPQYSSSTAGLENYLTYNEANKSVTLGTPTDKTAGWNLMANTYGGSTLGNYEVVATIRTDVEALGTNRNLYFGNYRQYASADIDYGNSQIKVASDTSTNKWNITGADKTYYALNPAAGIKITLGYVNGYYYWYLNDNVATLEYFKGGTGTVNTNNGNTNNASQAFGFGLHNNTVVEISSFSYERLDKAFSATADGTEEAYILARMEKKALEAQSFEMIKGASVRMANPSGLRFAATFAQSYVDLWKAQGYAVELGVLIAPTQYITTEKGTLELTNANYVEGTDYQKIVCTDGEYSVIDGMARLNGVLEVKTANYGVTFSGVAYIKLTKDGVTTYKYAKTNENERSIKEVATAALDDQKADYSDEQRAVLKQIAGITE